MTVLSLVTTCFLVFTDVTTDVVGIVTKTCFVSVSKSVFTRVEMDVMVSKSVIFLTRHLVVATVLVTVEVCFFTFVFVVWERLVVTTMLVTVVGVVTVWVLAFWRTVVAEVTVVVTRFNPASLGSATLPAPANADATNANVAKI